MNFSVKALSKGGARAGVLQVGGCSMETPALLLSTRKGLPAFISPDLLSTLPTPDSRLLQFSPLHFVEGISLKVVSEMGGLHQMLGLKEHVFAANPADPILSVPDHQSSNKIGASFETPSGRFLIKPGQYIEMISSMKPDMWVTLSDEVPAWVTDKRNKASVQRTMRWLDDCLALDNTNDTGGAVFGSIVGGSQINERIYCAQEVSRRNVSGFHIGGFGLGESMDERPALLSAVTESLPEDKPRQISGLGLPEEVLQGVAAGIDLFNSTYIYHLTIGGFALIFTSEEIERHGSVDQLSDTVRDDGTKINLKATIYRKDTSRILEGCKCYTCQNHTKAYINHLFNVHEMLAQILLEIHNTHHYLGFFRKIRDTIREGTFEEFRHKFVESRREHAAPAADAAAAAALCA
ncbi:queuine tRNA-ribosyltransferase accessory subunit 2-like [Salvia splendens]|uniref:queuine tRNA-ribosyltransferase accessory subunit 2-like n=1 Tax=Salvia splendens TaxID=180675 RepID=UPI001C25A317|nr:queuine tRNA-ribosyltransferase accessory subunit 2-like [Salvia splendens]